MRRREFIAGLACAAASRSAHAQTIARRFRIGVLDTSARRVNANFTAFQQALVTRGYVDAVERFFDSYPQFAAMKKVSPISVRTAFVPTL